MNLHFDYWLDTAHIAQFSPSGDKETRDAIDYLMKEFGPPKFPLLHEAFQNGGCKISEKHWPVLQHAIVQDLRAWCAYPGLCVVWHHRQDRCTIPRCRCNCGC